MGRRANRQVYDPTIVSRLADDAADQETDDAYFSDTGSSTRGTSNDRGNFDRNPLDDIDGYLNPDEERQDTQEILDPTLHGLPRKAPHASSASRRKRCLLGTVLAAVVLAAVIATTVVVTQKNKGSSKERHAPLAAPPADLPGLCTEMVSFRGADVTADDLAECAAACAPAACCEIPAQFDSSCLKGNEDVCLQYHAQCYVLSMVAGADDPFAAGLHAASMTVTVPNAPADLPEVCSTNSLVTNTGVSNCAKVCQPFECCYESNVPSCLDQATCAQYGPCLNLKAHDAVAPSIKEEVDALCKPRQTLEEGEAYRPACANACKLARCCATEAGCYLKDDAGFCDQYQSCSVLWEDEQNQSAGNPTVPAAGDDGNGDDGGDDVGDDDAAGDDTYYDDAYYDDDDFVSGDDGGQGGDDQDDLFQTLPSSQWGDDNPQNWDDATDDSVTAGDDGGDDTTDAGDDGGDGTGNTGDDGGDDTAIAGNDGGDDSANAADDGGDGTGNTGDDGGDDTAIAGNDGDDTVNAGDDGGDDTAIAGDDGGDDTVTPANGGDDTFP